MTELTGKALKDRASELNVIGRSKMNADELRAAIRDIERADNRVTKEHVAPAVAERNAFLLRQATSNVLGSASPMTSERRSDIYLAASKVTPKMARRARKAENKARG